MLIKSQSLNHLFFVFFNLLNIGSCSATLKFTVKDCDPTTGEPDSDKGYEDDYVVCISFSFKIGLFLYHPPFIKTSIYNGKWLFFFFIVGRCGNRRFGPCPAHSQNIVRHRLGRDGLCQRASRNLLFACSPHAGRSR